MKKEMTTTKSLLSRWAEEQARKGKYNIFNDDCEALGIDDEGWNISVIHYDNGEKFEFCVRWYNGIEDLETMVYVDYNTPDDKLKKIKLNEIENLRHPKTYHIKGYMDMDSMIEVNFGENEFKTLKEAYLAAKENLEYCNMEIVEESTGLRILLTSDEIDIWNEKPKVHFKQQRPRTYKDLKKIFNEIFLS